MSESNSAHNHAVKGLNDARQTVRRFVFELERTSAPKYRIFINDSDPRHPQKNAHAAALDYYEELNQPEYYNMVEKIWQEKLTDAKGNEITVPVPKSNVVEKTVTEVTGIDNMAPDLSQLETKNEKVSLETLGDRWRHREITVRATVDSPYRAEKTKTRQMRMWMPPVVIKAAYSQLNSCMSRIGLLAKTSAPTERDPDPI